MATSDVDIKIGLDTSDAEKKAKTSGEQAGKQYGDGFDEGFQKSSGTESSASSAIGKIGSAVKTAAITAAAAAATGFAAISKEALDAYAQYEQMVGGVETLFQSSAGTVKSYAEQAYMTAGVSATKYMEQATSFSASLIQSLGGDTEAAAEYANMAIVDMSDNANKMGTSIDSLQLTYQSLMRGNYAMLDNLKLGYGGTKSELERLVADAEKLTGQALDPTKFSDIVTAIHAVQESMGITGTTAEEASSTIQGSVGMMKAAWEDWLTALGRDDVDMNEMTKRLVDSVITAAENVVPRAIQIGGELASALVNSLPGAVSQIATAISESASGALGDSASGIVQSLTEGVATAIPEFLAQAMPMVEDFSGELRANAGKLVDAGIQLLLNVAQGLADSMPTLIETVPTIVSNIAGIINDNAPKIFMAAVELIAILVKGLIDSIPTIIENLPQIINAIVDTILAFNWISLGKNIITALGDGIKSMVSWIRTQAGNVATNIVNAIKSLPSNLMSLGSQAVSSMGSGISVMLGWLRGVASSIGSSIVSAISSIPSQVVSIGTNIVRGIWNGISGAAGWLQSQISGFASGVVSGIKSFFGIQSPSKVMRDQVGKYLAEGIYVGFEKYDPMSEINRSLSSGVRAMSETAKSYQSSTTNNNSQTLIFNQPVQTPDEVARTMRMQQRYGLAGAR